MKNFLLLFITSGVLVMGGGAAYAQSTVDVLFASTLQSTPSIKRPKEARGIELHQVLAKMENRYRVSFMYNSTLKNSLVPNLFNPDLSSIGQQLDHLFKDTDLTYKKVDDRFYVILKKRPAETKDNENLNEASDASRDLNTGALKEEWFEFIVKGRVTDEIGQTLPGVNILVKGSTVGTTTDINGNYTMAAPDGASVLIFSYIGYATQEIAIENKTVIDVSLLPDVKSLSEVVVIAYGQTKKSDLTGSVATLPVEDMRKVAVTSLDQALQGRASGVQITQNSASPGGSTTIRIRGGNSIQGDNEPLYVIDGIPFKNGGATSGSDFNVLSTLNPSDIESMTVLKDASSTAIYGSRGANGVVIITTKRGKAGKSSVNFESYYGFQQVRRKYPLLNGSEYATMVNEANTNEGKAPVYTPAQVEGFGKGTDWQDEILRTAPISNYQLTMTGGDDKTQYAIAGGYFKQEGIIINSNFDRASFRVNLDRKLTDKIKVGNSLSINSTNTHQSKTDGDLGSAGQVIMNALQFPPILNVRNADGSYLTTDPALSFTIDNPVALARDGKNQTKAYRALGNVFAEVQIINGLSFKTLLGIDGIFQKQDNYIPKTVVSGASQGGFASIANNQSMTWLNENLLNYSKTFNEKHQLSALLGYTLQGNRSESAVAQARSFVNDNLGTNNLGSGSVPLTPSSNVGTWGLQSYLSRVNYSLNSKYLFTASFRVDGSSRFGKNNRYGYFPSGAFAWRIKEESFLSDVKMISDLKLRTSYGQSGNQDGIGNYPAYSLLSTQNYVFGGVTSTGIGPSQIANPDLSWEKTTQMDVGIDMGLFDDRIVLTTDLYLKKTKDLLLNVTIPSTSGYTSAIKNLGKLENRGIEISINSINTEGDFKWTTNVNFAANRNKVLDIGGVSQIYAGGVANIAQNVNSGIIQVGQPLGSFYGFVTDGVYQTAEEIKALPDASAKKPGDRKYADLNGDGKIDDNDRIIIGRAQPKFIGGISNTFSYKGFDLTVFLQGVYGNNILNANRFELEYLSGTTNQDRDMLNRWTPANTDTDIPRASTTRPANRISTRQMENGSYLRLKNVQLAYNFPSAMFKSNIKSLRIYATAQNYLTWTHYSGFDPEVNRFGQDSRSQGFDYGSYPAAKTLLFGLNIGF
jgi:TonB-linked SusC/RagA family outer membrane protein